MMKMKLFDNNGNMNIEYWILDIDIRYASQKLFTRFSFCVLIVKYKDREEIYFWFVIIDQNK